MRPACSFALCPALLVLLACSPDSPETRIRKSFDVALKAVENADAAAAVELLDAGFQGPDGMTRAEAHGYLAGWFRREKIGVTLVAEKLEVRGNQAIQVVDLLLTGRSGGAVLPQESSRRTLQLRWTFTGKAWRVKELRTEGAY